MSALVRPDGETRPARRRDVAIVVLSSLVIFLVHASVPAGPHDWHWVHLVARKLYLLPILFAVARLGLATTVATTGLVSMLFLVHVMVDWRGQTMLQPEQAAELVTFWIVGPVTAVLFQRVQAALLELARAHEDSLAALAASLELREQHTAGHSERVRDYSLLLASAIGIREPRTLDNIRTGALFHDIGKIGIPNDILLKKDVLSPAELLVMREHPRLGAQLIGTLRFLSGTRELVLCHHERFDGGGYPLGIAGEKIPLGARIFAVADSFDAMTSNRPYHAARTVEDARLELLRQSGHQFDPVVVEAFLAVPLNLLADVARTRGHHVT